MKCEQTDEIENAIIESINVPRGKEVTLYNYPSQLLSCLRSRYYSWTMSEKPPEKIDKGYLVKHSVFDLGNAVEEMLGGQLDMAGLLPSPGRRQFRIRSREQLISGNIDFLILKDGINIPIECKSTKKGSYDGFGGWHCVNCGKKLWKNAKQCKDCMLSHPEMEYRHYYKGAITEPSESHYAQLQSYLNVGNFDYGYLYYHCKDDSRSVWWRVEKDEEYWADIIKRNSELREYVDNEELPPREYKAVFDINGDIKDSGDWQCRYCDWHPICWKDEIDEQLAVREQKTKELFAGG